MFDKAAILRAAWANYRRRHNTRAAIHGPQSFDRADFAFMLQIAWADAKHAALSPREQEIAVIRGELDALNYKPARVDTTAARMRLRARLSALAA